MGTLTAALLTSCSAIRASDAPEPIRPAELACQVWLRERAFAESVAAHDSARFLEFIEEAAVFGAASPQEMRGKDAILKAWRGFLSGERVRLSWRPQHVSVDGEGRLALSRGPYVFASLREGSQSDFDYFVGEYVSVWTRRSDGSWRVVFDGGGPAPRPVADAAAAQAHLATAPARCEVR